MKYKELLLSPIWKEYKKVARILFNNQCYFCNSTENLQLHHTKYYKNTTIDFDEVKKLPKNNFRWFLLICDKCHKKIHEINKIEKCDVYKATKLFRNRYFINKRLWLSKRIIKIRLKENNYDRSYER